MAKLASIFGLLEKLESPNITVHQNRCVVVRDRNATCLRCAKACTSTAICLRDDELVITPDLCIGCGTCATVCPTGALEAHRPDDGELLNESLGALNAAEGEAVIACGKALEANEGVYDPERVVATTCLGRVEESLLVSLVERGATHIALVRGNCERCDHITGLQTAELVKGTANVILKTWNQDARVDIVNEFPNGSLQTNKPEYDYNRRACFSELKKGAMAAAGMVVTSAADDALGVSEEVKPEPKYMKVMADGTLPHVIPDRRTQLLNTLAVMGTPEDDLIETRLWGHVIIDTALCSSCQMCATFCPTGALFKFSDRDGSFGVEHLPRACVKCRCCSDICPKDAISISDEVFATDLLDGTTERYYMKARPYSVGEANALSCRMRDMLGSDQIYEY